MEWLLQRWSSQACLIYGRRLREPIPPGKTAQDVMLMRWVDLEYSADDGGDVPPRYLPGTMPLCPLGEAPTGEVDYVLGTLELSAGLADGRNAFGRAEPYPPDLLVQQERQFAEVARLFADELDELAQDSGPAWHLVAGRAAKAELMFGAIVRPDSAADLPEGVLHLSRGQSPEGSLHPQVAVGALVGAVDARQGHVLVDPQALAPERYTTALRVIRNFWPHAKTGFVVVPTARADERPPAVEPNA